METDCQTTGTYVELEEKKLEIVKSCYNFVRGYVFNRFLTPQEVKAYLTLRDFWKRRVAKAKKRVEEQLYFDLGTGG